MRLADNDAQREELYAPVLAGQRSAAFGFTEAPGAQRTQAVPCTLEGGEPGFAVTGRKAFVTGGDSADWIVVVANVPPNMHADAEAGGTALLVVDRDARGVEQGEVGASIDGATHCPFSFSETPVPESRLLGRIGDGLPRALANIDQMRLSVAASAVGYSRWANRATLKRIEGPHRSGTALAEREQVQAIFADNVTETYVARATLYGAARALELGVPSASTQVAIAKSTATETLGRVVDRSIQLHGAQALLRGHALERLLRIARSLRIAEGPTELLRLMIARDARTAGTRRAVGLPSLQGWARLSRFEPVVGSVRGRLVRGCRAGRACGLRVRRRFRGGWWVRWLGCLGEFWRSPILVAVYLVGVVGVGQDWLALPCCVRSR